jgi:malate dehydrogenase (oxaloacetate-decarboxylating)(NADP+)
MNIPVFHDDQHGTAIISCAALINAAELAGKKLIRLKLLLSGAGASAIAAVSFMFMQVQKRKYIMFDSKGCITKTRKDLNKYKQEFASEKEYASLDEAMKGADVFVGFQKADVSVRIWLNQWLNPIVFAMANPDPEIMYDDATSVRKDLLWQQAEAIFLTR